MTHFAGWQKGGKASPRQRHEKGRMNRLESDYAELLAACRAAAFIAAFDFEPLKLRLGDACYYEVDFLVQASDATMEVHEVKGFWKDDARVKWRAAAEMHPWLRFFALTREKGGLWVAEPAWIEDRDRASIYGAVRGLPAAGVAEVGRVRGARGRRKSDDRQDV